MSYISSEDPLELVELLTSTHKGKPSRVAPSLRIVFGLIILVCIIALVELWWIFTSGPKVIYWQNAMDRLSVSRDSPFMQDDNSRYYRKANPRLPEWTIFNNPDVHANPWDAWNPPYCGGRPVM